MTTVMVLCNARPRALNSNLALPNNPLHTLPLAQTKPLREGLFSWATTQPEELRQVAQETADEALGKFDELEQTVDAKQDELINSLAQQYNEKLAELDAELEKMKEEDKGLFAKAKDAIGGVIETIQELKAMLKGVLARAASFIERSLAQAIPITHFSLLA